MSEISFLPQALLYQRLQGVALFASYDTDVESVYPIADLNVGVPTTHQSSE